ncbi:MAG: B12-binding domain-containing radical SAM protein, partial [Candidatus Hodarchaeota archaeon]
MNILFICSYSFGSEGSQGYYFGISYISAVLKSHGYQTDLLFLTRATKTRIIDQHIVNFQPQIICFTAVTLEYFFISKIAKYIKNKFPDIFLIIGGLHASLNPKQVIRGFFDAVCIGEGEYPTLELVQHLEQGKKPNQIQNLWIKGKIVEKKPIREFIQNLDDLPFPDREMWQKWIKPSKKSLILIGRGCPFQCPYCCNHALRKLASGKYVRLRSVENILLEVQDVVTRFPETELIHFEIETLGINREFDLKLCSELEKFSNQRLKPLNFSVNLRITPNQDYEPLIYALKKANFNLIMIGVESGSERIRKSILKRYYSNTDIIKAIRLAKKHGLAVRTYNMIGFPGETVADFKQTIQVNRACLPDQIPLYIFF